MCQVSRSGEKRLSYVLGFLMKAAGPDAYHPTEGNWGWINQVNRVCQLGFVNVTYLDVSGQRDY